MKDKFDSKNDEGIFLGCSTRIKAYKCLSKRINKMIESENVKIDELSEKNDEDNKKEPEDYNKCVYIEHVESNTILQMEEEVNDAQLIKSDEGNQITT